MLNTRPMNVADVRLLLEGLDPLAPLSVVCRAIGDLEVHYVEVDSLTGGLLISARPMRVGR